MEPSNSRALDFTPEPRLPAGAVGMFPNPKRRGRGFPRRLAAALAGGALAFALALASPALADSVEREVHWKNNPPLAPWQIGGLERLLQDPDFRIVAKGLDIVDELRKDGVLPSADQKGPLKKAIFRALRRHVVPDFLGPSRYSDLMAAYDISPAKPAALYPPTDPKPKSKPEPEPEPFPLPSDQEAIDQLLRESPGTSEAKTTIKRLDPRWPLSVQLIDGLKQQRRTDVAADAVGYLARSLQEKPTPEAIAALQFFLQDDHLSDAWRARFASELNFVPPASLIELLEKEASPVYAIEITQNWLLLERDVGIRADEIQPYLLKKLTEIAQARDIAFASIAAGELAALGQSDPQLTQRFVDYLTGPDSGLQSASWERAITLLPFIREVTASQFEQLLPALKSKPNTWVEFLGSRASTPLAKEAVSALQAEISSVGDGGIPRGTFSLAADQLAAAHAPGADGLLSICVKESAFASVRKSALISLLNLGDNSQETALLLSALEDKDREVRVIAARGLARLWRNDPHPPLPTNWSAIMDAALTDPTSLHRDDVTAESEIMIHLSRWRPYLLREIFETLFLSRSVDGIHEGSLLRCLVPPDGENIISVVDLLPSLSAEDRSEQIAYLTYLFSQKHAPMLLLRIARSALSVPTDDRAPPPAGDVPYLIECLGQSHDHTMRAAIAATLAWICENTDGVKDDAASLQNIRDTLEKAAKTDVSLTSYAATAERCYATVDWWHRQWEKYRFKLFCLAGLIASHILGWSALLLLYPNPKFAWVQAAFIWNKPVRKWLGLGYVSFLLQWVPPLRRRLFAPFRGELLVEARLKALETDSYFPDSEVVRVIEQNGREAEGTRQRVVEAITDVKSQILLEGESGLGKTFFVRNLLRRAQAAKDDTIYVFVPAQRCAGGKGLVGAIGELLQGIARDTAFLEALIFAGAISIVLDGLNEVEASVREDIERTLRGKPNARILITTQRMKWTPPPRLAENRWRLQPLNETQVGQFLLQAGPANAPADYAQRCADYVQFTLPRFLAPAIKDWALSILSNPMELTLATRLLAAGQEPNPFDLLKEAFDLMARQFASESGRAFNETGLAKDAYDRSAERTIDRAVFGEEVALLLKHRWAVEVPQAARVEGQPAPVRYRHEKFWAWFVAFQFQHQPELRARHSQDNNFNSVYQQLALRLPIEEAQTLLELLSFSAARTGNHTLVDAYAVLLSLRRQRDQGGAALA